MTLNMKVTQTSSDLWVATLILNAEGKASNTRDFIVNGQQLAFLRTIVENFRK